MNVSSVSNILETIETFFHYWGKMSSNYLKNPKILKEIFDHNGDKVFKEN